MYKSQLEPSAENFVETQIFVENIFDTVKKAREAKAARSLAESKLASYDYSFDFSPSKRKKTRKNAKGKNAKAKNAKTTPKKKPRKPRTPKEGSEKKKKATTPKTPRKYTKRAKVKPQNDIDDEEAAFILSSISQRSFDSFYNRLNGNSVSKIQIPLEAPQTVIRSPPPVSSNNSAYHVLLDHNYWIPEPEIVKPEEPVKSENNNESHNMNLLFTVAELMQPSEPKVTEVVTIVKPVEVNNNIDAPIKKRWLRQATTESTSPPVVSPETSPSDNKTPLKKRRVVLDNEIIVNEVCKTDAAPLDLKVCESVNISDKSVDIAEDVVNNKKVNKVSPKKRRFEELIREQNERLQNDEKIAHGLKKLKENDDQKVFELKQISIVKCEESDVKVQENGIDEVKEELCENNCNPIESASECLIKKEEVVDNDEKIVKNEGESCNIEVKVEKIEDLPPKVVEVAEKIPIEVQENKVEDSPVEKLDEKPLELLIEKSQDEQTLADCEEKSSKSPIADEKPEESYEKPIEIIPELTKIEEIHQKLVEKPTDVPSNEVEQQVASILEKVLPKILKAELPEPEVEELDEEDDTQFKESVEEFHKNTLEKLMQANKRFYKENSFENPFKADFDGHHTRVSRFDKVEYEDHRRPLKMSLSFESQQYPSHPPHFQRSVSEVFPDHRKDRWNNGTYDRNYGSFHYDKIHHREPITTTYSMYRAQKANTQVDQRWNNTRQAYEPAWNNQPEVPPVLKVNTAVPPPINNFRSVVAEIPKTPVVESPIDNITDGFDGFLKEKLTSGAAILPKTKTASADPRLNPLLVQDSKKDEPSTPKKKLSLDQYRKRKSLTSITPLSTPEDILPSISLDTSPSLPPAFDPSIAAAAATG